MVLHSFKTSEKVKIVKHVEFLKCVTSSCQNDFQRASVNLCIGRGPKL